MERRRALTFRSLAHPLVASFALIVLQLVLLLLLVMEATIALSVLHVSLKPSPAISAEGILQAQSKAGAGVQKQVGARDEYLLGHKVSVVLVRLIGKHRRRERSHPHNPKEFFPAPVMDLDQSSSTQTNLSRIFHLWGRMWCG